MQGEGGRERTRAARLADGSGRQAEPVRLGPRLSAFVRPLPSLLRRLAGMPDYDAHVAHLRRCHPERPLPSRREFFESYVAARYGDGPTRCC